MKSSVATTFKSLPHHGVFSTSDLLFRTWTRPLFGLLDPEATSKARRRGLLYEGGKPGRRYLEADPKAGSRLSLLPFLFL